MKTILALLLATTMIGDSFAAIAGSQEDSNSINRSAEARNMISSIASSLMSRNFAGQANGSQVVSLNLTNLFVLVLLKALIFAAGSLGAGTWKGGLARSLDGEEKFITEDEILLYLGYLTGAPGQNGCLQSIACRDPMQAHKYATAGEMLLKASRMFAGQEGEQGYETILRELREAVAVGMNNGDCRRYNCGGN